MNLSERIRYADLVDVSKLQVLMESFHQVLGIANAVIDVDGQVLAQAGWQEACVNFHRVNPESRQHCVEGDTALVKNMTCGRRHAVYKCLNGLVDTASPTMVAGQHMANVFSGQFLTAPPDLEFFRQQARHFGFDEAQYIASISKLPIVPLEKVQPITEMDLVVYSVDPGPPP